MGALQRLLGIGRMVLGAERENRKLTGKGLDLLPDYINASVIAGVQLQHHLTHVLWAVDLACEGEDGRCFARTGRTVEEEMG